ncbi:hypothetical protein [Falsiroseomonas sp.]|uniref:hypothetical protein n=1 Tax=Falsiroseomonas sp. TaxID=2870721 RepID=UPI00356946FF
MRITRRHGLVLLPALLAGCTVFPDRPNVPVRRYGLAPRRPESRPPRRGGPVLLVRSLRGVPGLQELGLRRVRPEGGYDIAPYEEWIAPPADLAEPALRAWLLDSGLFAAVVAPGSRAEASLVLEAQLTRLEAAPAAGEARAALSGVLLREERLSARILAPLEVSATAPLAANAEPPAQAEAMEAALGGAFTALERAIAQAIR